MNRDGFNLIKKKDQIEILVEFTSNDGTLRPIINKIQICKTKLVNSDSMNVMTDKVEK